MSSEGCPRGRAARWALALVLVLPAPAGAQGAARGVRLLPRADVEFSWLRVHTPDRRFYWLADIGFDLDAIDYATGRVRLRGRHEAVVGRERRRYDPNQANYAFDVAISRRVGLVEFSAVAQHASRHVLDREFPVAISWNAVGGRAGYASSGGFDAAVDVLRVWDRDFVDYTWTARVAVGYARPVGPRARWFAAGAGDFVRGVAADRSKGSGVRLEGGVRLPGAAASLELFGRYERRLDAYPAERGRVRFSGIGFRVATGRR